jgi:hypothetical protein
LLSVQACVMAISVRVQSDTASLTSGGEQTTAFLVAPHAPHDRPSCHFV